jgi:hypothetical protein
MTQIKRRDIIKLHYEMGDAICLVDEISDTNIHLREPPDKTHVLAIQDGIIEGVVSIELVYSAPVTGIAIARNFVVGESIVLVYKSAPEEEKVGLITRLEEDMIDVDVDGVTIYIDFGYERVPEEFQSITLHEGFIFGTEDDYYIPESQHRYTLERQLSDMMDKLLAVPKQTSRTIQNANRIVQRFRELRQLFSNDQLEPQRALHELTPYQVKWILPVLDLLGKGRIRRTLFIDNDVSMDAFREMEKIQLGQDPSTNRSFRSIYTKLLNEIQPFISDYNGEEITSTIEVLLPKPELMVSTSPKFFKEIKGKSGTFLSQVLIKPYADPYKFIETTPEKAHFASYFALPVDYTRAFVTGDTLLSRIHYEKLALYTHVVPNGNPMTLPECVPSSDHMMDTIKDFYSIQGCIQQLSPYLIHQNNLSLSLYETILGKLKEYIQTYNHKIKLPVYTPNPLLEYEHQSASEYQVSLLHTDNGSLYAITQCKKMILDYTKRLDEHIEKRLKPSSIAPPVVKVYANIKQLKEDNSTDDKTKEIFYDKEFDKTDYAEYKGMKLEDLIKHLVRVEYMPPSEAYLYAPHFLKNQRPVLNGDYAQLVTPSGNMYYKRINQVWKLDDTCPGPYPCTSDEPECTVEETSCVDVSFRLKQNLIHSILVDYQLDMYTSKAVFDKFIQDQEKHLTYLIRVKKHLSEQSTLKYNNRMKAMGKSIVIIKQSPNVSLLNLILQKPIAERYAELSLFIRDYTRVAHHTTEDDRWLYCVTSGLQLLPTVFQSILQGYEEQTYKETLDRLVTVGSLKIVEGSFVTDPGGFTVAPIDLEYTFDEMVHSTEFEDDPIYKLKRGEDPLNPFLIELLNVTSIAIGVNVTVYYNFIIHKVLSNPSNLLNQVVALVLKFAEIEYNISLDDKIDRLLKKTDKYQTLFTKFEQSTDFEFSLQTIQKELKKVSNYYEVKQLLHRKPKRAVGLQKTSSTVWDTFLPPSKIPEVTSAVPEYKAIMTILKMIQDESHKKVLREGNYRVNTIHTPIVPPAAYELMDKWVPFFMTYTKNIVFIPTKNQLPYDKHIVETPLPPIQTESVVVVKDTKNFEQLIPELVDKIHKRGFDVDLNMDDVPIVYLQSFIHNIGRLYPSFLLYKPEYYSWYYTPFTYERIIKPQHEDKLKKFSQKSIFNVLSSCSSEHLGLRGILDDPAIDFMIDQFRSIRTEDMRTQCIYYIYSIFDKYITGCSDEHQDTLFRILQIFCDSFARDVKKVFMKLEDIDTYILKQKTTEANDRQLQRDQMSWEDRILFDFRQTMNLSKEAQLGRKRTYDPLQHQMESDLFGTSHEDNDGGDDGNGGDNDDITD